MSGRHWIVAARIPALVLLHSIPAAWAQAPPESADAADPALTSFLSANGLLNRGLHDLAAAEYRQFLKSHPAHEKTPLARYGLAVCLVRLNEPREAAELLGGLVELREFSFAAEVLTLRGQCLLTLERHPEAAAAFEDAIKRFPQHELADDAAAGLVEARHRAGAHEAAVAACRAFAERWPQSALLNRVEFLGAISEMTRGDSVAAGARFGRVAEREPNGSFAEQAEFYAARCAQQSGSLDAAERGYRAVLARSKSRFEPDALYGLALVLSGTRRAADAGELLDRLLADHADHPLAAAARFERARVFFALEQFDRARQLFDAAAGDINELTDDARYWAAKCSLRLDEPAAAAERLAAALAAHGESNLSAEMAYDRAVALARAGKPGDAAAAIATFLRDHARHALAPDALHLLAAATHDAGEHVKSVEHCDAFLKAHPAHALAGAVRLLAADGEYAAGRYARAAGRYERVLADQPAPDVLQRVQLRRGLALFQIERFDEAAASLKLVAPAAESDPDFRPALLALGEIAFRGGDWPAAERHLATYLAANGDVPAADDALLKLGVARQRQSRPGEALEAFDRLLAGFERSPHRGQALFERGQALAALNRNAESIAALEQALEQQGAEPFAAYANYHIGVLAQRQGEPAKAAERFAAVLRGRPDAALAADARFHRGLALLSVPQDGPAAEALAAFVDQHPDDARRAEARARLALALARLKREADAAAQIEQLAEPDLAGLEPALRAAVQYEQAAILKRGGRADEAAARLRQLAGSDNPLRLHAALELAEIEMAAKRFEAAAAVLREARTAVENRPIEPALAAPLLYRLGVCAFESKQWEYAANAFEELLALDADSPLAASASFFAGEAHFQAGRPARAAEHLARAVEKYGRAADAGPAMLRLGECAATQQQWTRSEHVFGEFLTRFPEHDNAYQARFGVGWARENLGRFDEAIDAYRGVVERHQGPTAARAQFQIGECLFAKKEYAAAVRELLKVDILYAYPEWSAAALFEAGRCFEALNKSGEARQHFTQVVEKFADTRWAGLARERLAARPADAPPGR